MKSSPNRTMLYILGNCKLALEMDDIDYSFLIICKLYIIVNHESIFLELGLHAFLITNFEVINVQYVANK